MNRTVALIGAGAMVFTLSTTGADAVTSVEVDVDGHTWEVSTIFSSFDSLQADLTQQHWWGDQSLAIDFAVAMGGALGYPNSFTGANLAPHFAYSLENADTDVFAWACNDINPCTTTSLSFVLASTTDEWHYAVASKVSSVPLPASGVLLLIGLAAAGFGFRKRAARA